MYCFLSLPKKVPPVSGLRTPSISYRLVSMVRSTDTAPRGSCSGSHVPASPEAFTQPTFSSADLCWPHVWPWGAHSWEESDKLPAVGVWGESRLRNHIERRAVNTFPAQGTPQLSVPWAQDELHPRKRDYPMGRSEGIRGTEGSSDTRFGPWNVRRERKAERGLDAQQEPPGNSRRRHLG